MSEEFALSRRKVLSVLGLAAALALAWPTVLGVSGAEAQTGEKKEGEKKEDEKEGSATGTERRHERREGRRERRHERRERRHERRHERRERRHERREDRKECGTEPKGETKSKQ
jgi:hypothetical protein